MAVATYDSHEMLQDLSYRDEGDGASHTGTKQQPGRVARRYFLWAQLAIADTSTDLIRINVGAFLVKSIKICEESRP